MNPFLTPALSPTYLEFQGRKIRFYAPLELPKYKFWTLRVERRGKVHWHSLGTDSLPTAKKRAPEFLRALFAEQWETVENMKAKSSASTLGELVGIYEAAALAVPLKNRTVRFNVACLGAIVDAWRPGNWRDVRITELAAAGDAPVRAFVAKRLQSGAAATVEARKVSINTMLASARSVFGKSARGFYEGVKLPDLTLFLSGHRQKVTKSMAYRPLAESVVREMEAAAISELRDGGRTQLYVAYLLASRPALRASEVWQARREWIESREVAGKVQHDLAILVRPDFVPKWRVEGRIPLSEGLVAELARYGGVDYLVDAPTMTQRKETVERELSAWLRRWMPEGQKTCHNLRKHAGSVMLMKTKNIYAVRDFLRHKSVTTTEKHYATMLNRGEPLEDLTW